jgi:hypothetical protein
MATIMAEVQTGHVLNTSDITSANILSKNTYSTDCVCLYVPDNLWFPHILATVLQLQNSSCHAHL